MLIGPAGIFTIETKTYDKPQGRRVVEYDGTSLRLPDRDLGTKPIEQAKAKAQTIQRILQGSREDKWPIRPVIAMPGWYIKPRFRQNHVWVVEPKGLQRFLENQPDRLTGEEIQVARERLEWYAGKGEHMPDERRSGQRIRS